MKTIRDTRIGKFLSDKNLGHLLAGVADMPPSAPLLVWLNDAVQDDDSLKAKEKQTFGDLCHAELEATKKTDSSREASKRPEPSDQKKEALRKRSLFLGVLNLVMF